MTASTIGSVNLLKEPEKIEIYTRLIPQELLERFEIPASFKDKDGNSLLRIMCAPGKTDVEMKLFHQADFPDPILYGHLTDTLSGQIHVLLYILNDPSAKRFDVDRMPDGQPTRFGTFQRNISAELAAMQVGLAPGQVRTGLRLLPAAILKFEEFVHSLGHQVYFVEPLYYHNAVLFERYGFSYQIGKRLMERIETGFSEAGDLYPLLNNSTPFKTHATEHSIRLRSWAIHDGLLGEPFTNVTMFKHVGKSAGINTCPSCGW
jgi:hypothetical protein